MTTKELSVTDVRIELEGIIEKYPHRNGRAFFNEYFGEGCVYYTDELKRPIYGVVEDDQRVLKNPICIAAVWIEELHPELKQIESVGRLLRRNDSISYLHGNRSVDNHLSMGAITVLRAAQTTQDKISGEGKTWKDINLREILPGWGII